MDDSSTIRELLAIMDEHALDRIKVRVGDALYELVRREPGAYAAPVAAVPSSALAGPAGGDTPGTPVAGPPANVKRVVAPLTGVFYRSSSPDTEVFVDVGSRVENGDVLCILEAMKLFNEIQSEYAGTVVRIVPQNGELVSQGEDLFWIES